MKASVEVIITKVAAQTQPPANLLRYTVRNSGPQSIWLVKDDWVVWHQQGQQIELSLARTRMQKGVQPFGYFAPEVMAIRAGESISRDLELTWPLSLSRIWNAQRLAAPEPGRYQLKIRIGYGLTPAPDFYASPY